MLLFKLLLTPLLIGLVSLAGRRWGPAVSGWLVSLPLTSGPVALFLALDQGNAFASRAAQGTLTGLISVAGFCLVYSWLSFRLNWLWSLLTSWTVFFIITAILEQITVPLIIAYIGVLCSLALTLMLLPAVRYSQNVVKSPPQWEMWLRMLVATAFVLLLTGAASLLGPQLSGLLTPFPIFASVLGVFTHRFQGSAATRRLLRGVVIGSFTFATFFLVIAAFINLWGILASFALAILTALCIHACSLFIVRRVEKQKQA